MFSVVDTIKVWIHSDEAQEKGKKFAYFVGWYLILLAAGESPSCTFKYNIQNISFIIANFSKKTYISVLQDSALGLPSTLSP